MRSDPTAENVLGTLGTICWTAQLLPQIWKSWHTKSVKGLSPWLVFFWGIVGCPLGIYNVIQNINIPLIVQPQVFGFLCIFSWGQCQYYGNRRPVHIAALMALGVMAIMAALEAAMIFAIRPHYEDGSRGAQRAVQFFGIISSIMISGALFPQYYEIWKYKEVIGISLIFITVDCMGGVFSVLSLVFKDKFDVVASVTYSAVIVLDGFVIIAAIILNPIANRRRRREAQLDISEVAPVSDNSTQ